MSFTTRTELPKTIKDKKEAQMQQAQIRQQQQQQAEQQQQQQQRALLHQQQQQKQHQQQHGIGGQGLRHQQQQQPTAIDFSQAQFSQQPGQQHPAGGMMAGPPATGAPGSKPGGPIAASPQDVELFWSKLALVSHAHKKNVFDIINLMKNSVPQGANSASLSKLKQIQILLTLERTNWFSRNQPNT